MLHLASCDQRRSVSYFKMVPCNDQKRVVLKLKNYDGPVNGYDYSSLEPSIRIEMIQELLDLENDKRICQKNVMNFSPASSIYTGPKEYSIQVEALFLINQLYFSKPFSFSPVPALIDDSDNIETVEGELISKAYEVYKKWFNGIQSDSIFYEASSLGDESNLNFLLNQENVRWFGSIGYGEEMYNKEKLKLGEGLILN